ncbi:MAG TPA: type VI secretion system baseplate subunit TssG, partial [Planctomycetaceae bacterium]
MAGADRAEDPTVVLYERLGRAPHEFDFFQALRRLECAHRERPRIGAGLRPGDDPLRLAQATSLIFSGSTLASFAPGAGGRPWRLSVNFFGLLGPNGPLPLHLTEYARDRVHHAGDRTLVRFLDIFHHRLLALFYRARAMAEPTAQFDRPETDRFALYVGALCGLGSPALRERDAMPDFAKLHFAGRLAPQVRNAEGLQALLTELLGVPAEVDEFVGHWMSLPVDCRCQLGKSPTTGVLGVSALIGDRVWNYQYKFRVVLGPLERQNYEEFLPAGDILPRVVAIIRNYIGDELAWDLRLVLKRQAVKTVELGRSGRLGWTTWLCTR